MSHACGKCSKAFADLAALWRHNEQCVTTAHETAHACAQCDKVFLRRANLRTHETVHTGARPYTCKICKHGFTCLSNLTRHIRRFPACKQQFSCSACKQQFVQASALEDLGLG